MEKMQGLVGKESGYFSAKEDDPSIMQQEEEEREGVMARTIRTRARPT